MSLTFSWQDKFNRAISEENPLVVESVLESARAAILARLQQLDDTCQLAKDERLAIGNALAQLSARYRNCATAESSDRVA